MALHLAEIASEIAPGKHAVILLDQAGWHLSRHLVVPATITLMPLPPKCPELNPIERLAVPARQLAVEPRLRQGVELAARAESWLPSHDANVLSLGDFAFDY
jgi:hypothetical protein